MIAGARRFVYAENQYFASRVVAEAIAKRLAEPDGPEFVIVNPKTVAGWLDEEVMGPARARAGQGAAQGRPPRPLPDLHAGDRGRRATSTSTPRS